MKTKNCFIALLMLTLFASCQSTRVQKDERSNALIQAAKDNNATEVRRLIADDADVNAKDNEDCTALMIATEKEATDIAELLEAAGARR